MQIFTPLQFIIIFPCTIDASPYHSNVYPGASVPIAVDYINCRGNETQWSQCRYSSDYIRFCTHDNDVGVRCYNGEFLPPSLAKKKKGSGRVNGVREAGICASVVSRGNSQLSELSQA